METINNTNAVEENKVVAEPKTESMEEMKEEMKEEEMMEEPKLEEVKIDENRQEKSCDKTRENVNAETKVVTLWKRMWDNVYKFVNYYTSCSLRKQNVTNTTNEPK